MLFDAQVGYEVTENVSATFSVNNILDKKYYSRAASSTVFNYYGEPRSAWLKVSAKF
jgi:outer-membrane receptor for ferric coprogen and ferric-rhodotorulic acid